MFKWFNFLPLGLFTLEQLLTQYGLSGQMSLGHTFSSALHYTGPLTSSGTPIKAIQAKSCVSLWLFLFLPRRMWDLLQSISTSFSFCLPFDTSWNLFFFTWIIGLRHTSELQKTHSGFIHWANFGANCLKTQESLTQDSLLGSLRSMAWKITLYWDICQDASWFPLWYTSKLWAADNLGTPHPGSCHVDSLSC